MSEADIAGASEAGAFGRARPVPVGLIACRATALPRATS